MQSKVLVVDDMQTNILISEAVLKEEGFKVSTAYDALNAFVKLNTEKLPDLILLDKEMPTLDGYALCKYLKNSLEYQKIPIVMYTASLHESELHSIGDICKDTKCDAFLMKGCPQEQLIETIKRLIKK